jgi:hypothetical protein
MKHYLIKLIIPGIFLVVITSSCDGYLDQFNMDRLSTEAEISPSIAAPVAYSSFSIQDILEVMNDSTGLISVSEDDLIYIYYSDTAFSMYAEDLMEIPTKISSETYIQSDVDIPAWNNLNQGEQYTFQKDEVLSFSIEPEDRIDSILIKSGSLNIHAYSQFHHAGELNITSSEIVDEAGDTLDITFTISQEDGTFEDFSDYDLSGYKVLMDMVNDEALAIINFNLTLFKSSAGISVDEEAGVILTFEDIKFNSVFGHIAPREITDMNKSMDIEFPFSVDEVPDIYFADPQFNITVHNSFGIPISLEIDTFTTRSFVDGSYTDLIFKNDTMNPYLIGAPTVDQLGEVVSTSREFNKETTNIDSLLSSLPDRIDFSFTARSSNPPGSTAQNFLLDTSKITLEAEVMLPMWFSTSGYTLRDTLDIALDSLMANLDFIESLGFRLTTTNQWPLELSAQIYFLNDMYEMVDSLFEEQTVIIDAATVDDEGEPEASLPTPHVVNVEVTESDLSDLEGATTMMLVIKAVTAENGGPDVKFYSKSMLDYQLSVYADFRINTSEMNFE